MMMVILRWISLGAWFAFFVKPLIEDTSSVHMSSVKAILPDPAPRGTTERMKGSACVLCCLWKS